MSSYYIVFNLDNVSLREPLRAVNKAFDGKLSVAEGSTHAEKIRSADFLIILLSRADELELPNIKADYKLFLDDIAWKRKKFGEIIFLVENEEFDFTHLPFRLKGLSYFIYDEINALDDYCLEQQNKYDRKFNVSHRYDYTPRVIEYKPHESAVKQIKFSIRAPKVERFDNTVKRSGNGELSGCSKDHVFTKAPLAKKQFVDEELNRGTPISQSVNPEKPPRKKSSTCGCVVAIVIVLAIFITIAIVIGNTIRESAIYSVNYHQSNIISLANEAEDNTSAFNYSAKIINLI